MSGTSDFQDCPKCGSKDSLKTYSDYKPYDISNGDCLECGFCFYTKEDQSTLEEVNELRVDYDLPPLEKLKEQKE